MVSSIRIVADDDDKTEGRRSDIMMMDDMEMMKGVDIVDMADVEDGEGRSRNRVAPITTASPLKMLDNLKIKLGLSQLI